jgi:hypothetical protein
MFSSFINCLIKGVMDTKAENEENGIIICYRCKVQDENMNVYCIDCKVVNYCSKRCMRKNIKLHEPLCRYRIENSALINKIMNEMKANHSNIRYEEQNKGKYKVK